MIKKRNIQIMKYLRNISLALILMATLSFVMGDFAVAQSAQEAACEGAGGTWSGGTCDDGADGISGVFNSIINVLLFLLGGVAVIMLIIGGFRYVVSGGDSSRIESAKNTILYAVIGIIVAFLAWAAVSFLVDSLG